MSERNIIKSILPFIEIENTNSVPLEKFQNQTLRQILKFQNQIILQVFELYLIENKVDFQGLSSERKKLKVNEILKENVQNKQFLLGLIIAFLSKEEFEFYALNKKEINKRITAMLIERIVSQVV